MGPRPRMNPWTFVQYTIHRRSAQTRRRDNFSYTYRSSNIHIGYWHRVRPSSARRFDFAMKLFELFADIWDLTVHLKSAHVNQDCMSDYDVVWKSIPASQPNLILFTTRRNLFAVRW